MVAAVVPTSALLLSGRARGPRTGSGNVDAPAICDGGESWAGTLARRSEAFGSGELRRPTTVERTAPRGPQPPVARVPSPGHSLRASHAAQVSGFYRPGCARACARYRSEHWHLLG